MESHRSIHQEQGLMRGRPSKRLKLPARVDYGMNPFSARRSLSATR